MTLADKLLKELRKPFYLITVGVFSASYIVFYITAPLVLGAFYK